MKKKKRSLFPSEYSVKKKKVPKHKNETGTAISINNYTPFYRNNNTNILKRILDLENCFLLLFRKQHKGLISKLTAFLPQERVVSSSFMFKLRAFS